MGKGCKGTVYQRACKWRLGAMGRASSALPALQRSPEPINQRPSAQLISFVSLTWATQPKPSPICLMNANGKGGGDDREDKLTVKEA